MKDFTFLGVGWRFPVNADKGSGHIEMSAYEQDIKEAIRIIIHTAKGERIMRPEFGSALRSYVFESISLSTLSKMAEEIKNSLVLWEARIHNVEVDIIPHEKKGQVNVSVSYSIRTTNNRYNLVFPYFLNEG